MADETWSELTSGPEPVVRVTAGDLQQAARARARLRGADAEVAVILDVTVAVAGDVRAAFAQLGPAALGSEDARGVQYAGTVSGLAGLLADIETAGVADGVTLVGASSPEGLVEIGRTVLTLLEQRHRACA